MAMGEADAVECKDLPTETTTSFDSDDEEHPTDFLQVCVQQPTDFLQDGDFVVASTTDIQDEESMLNSHSQPLQLTKKGQPRKRAPKIFDPVARKERKNTKDRLRQRTKRANQRHRTFLSYENKLQMIDQVEEGVSQKDVAARFQVNRSTVSQILKNREEILSNAALANQAQRVSKLPLDGVLLAWLKERGSQGLRVTGPEVCAKAREISQRINGNDNFKVSTFVIKSEHVQIHYNDPFQASDGWLDKFKSRHGITNLQLIGEAISADSDTGATEQSDLDDTEDSLGTATVKVETIEMPEPSNVPPNNVLQALQTIMNWMETVKEVQEYDKLRIRDLMGIAKSQQNGVKEA